MKYVGVDLHKQSITLCVMIQEDGHRKVADRRTFACSDTGRIAEYFSGLGTFQVVVEATAAYEWFLRLVEPEANRVVLAHPKKLRVIAESKRKTDKIDAQVLAEFLLLDMIPEAYRPTPRQREHRVLVRQRYSIQSRITSVKNKLRHKLAMYNADCASLFSEAGRVQAEEVKVSEADAFVMRQLWSELEFLSTQLDEVNQALKQFGKRAPVVEREARAVLDTIPYVGPVTIDVVVSELGDVRRFRSQKKVVSYAGLAPGIRASSRCRRELGITKEGSRLLRWALVEAAWRVVGRTRYWGHVYEKLKARMGAKKAIVAVARRLLCVMASMLRSGQAYKYAREAKIQPQLRLDKRAPAPALLTETRTRR
jgi:transposase